MKRWLKTSLSFICTLAILCTLAAPALASGSVCPGCNGTIYSWTSISDTEHSYYCRTCKRTIVAPHNPSPAGSCYDCNYNTSSYEMCTHCGMSYLTSNNWQPAPMYPDHHVQVCPWCEEINYREHILNPAGICYVCGNTNISNEYNNISVTISGDNDVYYFTDDNTLNGLSVYDQILTALSFTNNTSLYDYVITFSNYNSQVGTLQGNAYFGSWRLSDLHSLYLSINTSGLWTTNYTVTLNGVTVLSGIISITIEPRSAHDIVYTATLGESVALNPSDFYDFWNNYTNGLSTLSSIRITSVQGLSGTVCYEHSVAEKNHTSVSGSTLYATPTGSQKGFSNLTFVPSKVSNKYSAGTATIHFTATGNRHYITGVSGTTVSVSGKIVIAYTNGRVTPISYTTSSFVNLNASDFDNVYRTATGSTVRVPSYTIKFLTLPAYGTLYRSYNNSLGANLGNLVNNQLNETNISGLMFSNRSGSTNYIGHVTYVPSTFTKASDSVQYAVYSGNTLVYIGTINFNAEEIIITYNCSGNHVTFSSADFFNVSTSMLYSQYISFGVPSSGSLYKNYSGGTGTPVNSYDYFSYAAANGVSDLNTVTYVPQPGFVGTVEIPFHCSTLTGISVSGRIRIYVTANVFTDVAPDSWSAPYINRLYASGVVGGTSATTFSPKANMKYGEALKMILLAAGYPKQLETGGAHWASNYLTLAYSKGIVSTTSIDLNALVNRDTVAELAAKALGLNAVSGVNAGIASPVDSTNGYVFALYNAGIVGGEFKNGVNYYNGSRNITREEVAKIICNIMDYAK